MLIIMSGLPGVGKTTIARELARAIGAVHIRIDSIEQALRDAGFAGEMNDAGYRIGYAIAADNLRLGRAVIADSVNPIALTRDAWRNVAIRAGVRSIDVEVICSDASEHRRRIETRAGDIKGHQLPTWDKILAREYHQWDQSRMVIDTALEDMEHVISRIAAAITMSRS